MLEFSFFIFLILTHLGTCSILNLPSNGLTSSNFVSPASMASISLLILRGKKKVIISGSGQNWTTHTTDCSPRLTLICCDSGQFRYKQKFLHFLSRRVISVKCLLNIHRNRKLTNVTNVTVVGKLAR